MNAYCTNPNILKIIMLVRTVLRIIIYIIPVILIVLIIIDFSKAVIGGEKELNKALSISIKRMISAVVIFFIPTIVNLVFSLISSNNSILNCYTNATSEKIDYYTTSNAKALIANTRKTLNIDDYNSALTAVNKIKDKEEQATLKNELEELKDTIDLNYKVDNLKFEINKLESYYSENEYNKLYSSVKTLPEGNQKRELTKLLEKIKKEAEEKEKIPAGEFVKNYGGMSYYVLIPEGSTANMPVVVFLGGDGINNYFSSSSEKTISSLHGLPIVSASINGSAYSSGKFILVVPQGKGAKQSIIQNGQTKYYNGTTWTDNGVPDTVMAIINSVINEYNADKNRISLTGFSRGAVGVWNYIYKYNDYFSAALPISCCGLNGSDYQRLKTTDVYAVTGYDHNGAYTSCMNNYVNKINSAGGNSKYYNTKVYDHGSNQGIVYKNSKTYAWLLCNTKGLNKNCAFPN